MVQGFFLDRINRFSADLPVRFRKKGALFVFTDPADTVFFLLYGAAMVTERAGYRGILVLFVLACLVHGRPLKQSDYV
jgi:hypothetical protein